MYSKLMNGYRPERPTQDTDEHMEDGLWELVQACWNEHPESRPPADDLVQRLHALDHPATCTCGKTYSGHGEAYGERSPGARAGLMARTSVLDPLINDLVECIYALDHPATSTSSDQSCL